MALQTCWSNSRPSAPSPCCTAVASAVGPPAPRLSLRKRGLTLPSQLQQLPGPKPVLVLRPPTGAGVRWDSGIVEGGEITAAFDPMVAKLIITGATRDEAIARADAALRDTVLLGCTTNTAFLRRLIAHPAFVSGDVHTGFLDANPDIAAEPELPTTTLNALLAAAALSTRPMRDPVDSVPDLHAAIGPWRN